MSTSSYKPVRSLQRGLDVLRHLNRSSCMTIGELHGATGLPKPTVVRVLETLVAEGYVRKQIQGGGYSVTESVRSLSAGFHEDSKLLQRGAELATELTRRIKWPLAIGTLDQGAMRVRESTIPHSPVALLRSSINMRLPLLRSAMGLAYLAFCPATERRILLEFLRASEHPMDRGARRRGDTKELLRATKRRGYGVREPAGRPKSGDSGSISVPVVVDDRVAACVSITFMARTATAREIARRHLSDLKQLASELEQVAEEY